MDAKDVHYEEDILRNPLSLKSWWAYLDFKAQADPKARFVIYDRACQYLPGSYKLWFRYLSERKKYCKSVCVDNVAVLDTNRAFERALVFMHKMPRIWCEYIEHLTFQKRITSTRNVCDRALRSLPVTQHDRIWPLFLTFVKQANVPEMGVRVFRRYLKIEPTHVEEYIKYLRSVDSLDEAAIKLGELVNDEKFVSQEGKSKNDLWTELLQLLTKNPDKITSLDVDAIIRAGLKRFPHEIGHLWNALADYYVRAGLFDKARDVYEEAMGSVTTAQDFTMVFDAYSQYEESMLQAQMSSAADNASDAQHGADSGSDSDSDLDETAEMDLRLARLEDLMVRRPLLLNSVMLRQNPHNVQEWQKRVKLHADNPQMVVKTYSEAVTTVDPYKAANGKPHSLWISFARFYEEADAMDDARTVYEKATKVNYKHVDDLATIWCQWAEMELRHNNCNGALDVLRRAAVLPSKRTGPRKNVPGADQAASAQQRLFRSTKLWSFYADLEENLGSLESTRGVYDQMISLKIVTPQIILNYAALMEEHKFFEESFKVYEKGVALFPHPHAYPIWAAYLTKFIGRFKGTKLERTRDLFEQAIEKAPPKEAKKLFLLFAKYEEDHGLARRAMAIYDRACKVVAPEDRFEMYSVYITRVAEFFGLTKTRVIYEKAIENLPDTKVRDMCTKYAAMERKLGEIDRARAVYIYASQHSNPKLDTLFWKTWYDFETQHGNKETFKEMLRIRRSVSAQFATTNVVDAAAALSLSGFRRGGVVAGTVQPPAGSIDSRKRPPTNDLEALEQQQEAQTATEVREEVAAQQEQASAASAGGANPEEIDILDDVDGGEDVSISQKAVPAAVFGSALQKLQDTQEEPVGALARLKKRKV